MATYWEIAQLVFWTVGWWLVPLVALFFYRGKLRKFPVDCIIYEKRGENLVYTKDVAGRFDEPINAYKLKHTKDTIPIPQYDWILQNMAPPANIFEKFTNLLTGKVGAITLFKYGSKQYKPIKVKIGSKVVRKFKPIRDSNGEEVYVTVYSPINPKKELSKLDFEVIDWDDINHMTQELRAIALRRKPLQTFLEKWGGHLALAIGFLSLVIAGFYFKEVIFAAGDKYAEIVTGQARTPQPAQTPPQLTDIIPGT